MTQDEIDGLRLSFAFFESAKPLGPALGDPDVLSWFDLCGVITEFRRESVDKDGPGLVAARLRPHPDNPRMVRRKAENVIARTAVALDLEGDGAPPLSVLRLQLQRSGFAAVIWTTHNHRREAPRCRLLSPLSEPIDPSIPAPDLLARHLQVREWLDPSKIGAASLFYLPSCPPGDLECHEAFVVAGKPITPEWIDDRMSMRRAAEEAISEAANFEANQRRQQHMTAAGVGASLIEQIRDRLGSIGPILEAHGYDRQGEKYRHPASKSGQFGLDIRTFGGVERAYSHNATDILAPNNLPDWCGVSAIDVVDVVAILGFGGDRQRALRELAERFGLDRTGQRKAVAAAIYKAVREGRNQIEIETAGCIEGERQGLTRGQVIEIAHYVAASQNAEQPPMRQRRRA